MRYKQLNFKTPQQAEDDDGCSTLVTNAIAPIIQQPIKQAKIKLSLTPNG